MPEAMMNEIQNGFENITLNGIGKKFREQWIFRNVTLEINKGDKIAVTGRNGSGKSTLLQLLSGYVSQSEGDISWHQNGRQQLPVENVNTLISFAAPYLELIEEFTLDENVVFFSRFKKLQQHITNTLLVETAGLNGAGKKKVKHFSSGMKQRLKLALAFAADTPLLLIDEPLSNLDVAGYEWYRNLVSGISDDRTVILCSNQVKEETYFCNRFINIEEYK